MRMLTLLSFLLLLFCQVSCDTVECTECVPECTDPMCEPEGEEGVQGPSVIPDRVRND